MTLSLSGNLECHKVDERIWHYIHWIPVVEVWLRLARLCTVCTKYVYYGSFHLTLQFLLNFVLIQVSQPYMWEDSFLQSAVDRYKCFLHILYKSEGKILCVPTFDIDLMWHSHQVHSSYFFHYTITLVSCLWWITWSLNSCHWKTLYALRPPVHPFNLHLFRVF